MEEVSVREHDSFRSACGATCIHQSCNVIGLYHIILRFLLCHPEVFCLVHYPALPVLITKCQSDWWPQDKYCSSSIWSTSNQVIVIHPKARELASCQPELVLRLFRPNAANSSYVYTGVPFNKEPLVMPSLGLEPQRSTTNSKLTSSCNLGASFLKSSALSITKATLHHCH